MSELGSLLAYLRDPRLAPHATGALPVWLWSADATQVLWANPVAAAVFDVASPAELAGYRIDPKGSAALQIARIAGTLQQGAAPRLERLRGFDARFGRALTCACSRVMLESRVPAVLVAAAEAAGPSLPLAERVRRLAVGIDEPVAFFSAEGELIHATPAAQARLAGLDSIAALGVETLAGQALTAGRVAGPSQLGAVALERIGADASAVLLATFAPAAAVAEPAPVVAEAPRAAVPAERRPSLRFVWQMDADGRLTFDSEDFVKLIGPHSAAALAADGLDPEGPIQRAIASRDTWSGITVAFPVDGADERLPVELSGLPVFDRERNFLGYRGFGICRDAARIEALARRTAPKPPEQRPTLTVVPAVENVLPFRSSAPAEKPPSLTPVERKAFRELATRLTARLREAQSGAVSEAALPELEEAIPPPPPEPRKPEPAPSEPVERPISADQRPILDRLPLGVLVYRLDRLLYANRAFLDWTGYDSIHALSDAGGLDALFIEPGASPPSPNGARSLAITTSRGQAMPIEARLFSTPWDGESALVLMLAGNAPTAADKAPNAAAETEVRELRSILDAAADGVALIDREGRIISINRSAEALFGYQSRELAGLPLAGLFTPESQRSAFDALDRVGREGSSGMLGEAREVFGRGRDGTPVPLSMSIKTVAAAADKLVAVFRDLAPWKKAEAELLAAKRQAEQSSSAKSDFLAKISHEIRTPLNAIIGFSEVMMEERFGALGNERYKQYLKDIHASGEHVLSLLNDLLDLSKIEAGKLELQFTRLDLNELTQQCVALMQPQANRERIIIRTALTSSLPAVLADARSVRQIALNLLSNSIKFTGAGGQVIVSTALNDTGEVVLRVRDTGAGMSEKDIAIALEPFRQLATSARFGSGGTGLGLPLTKALAEANRATFSITSAVNAGTLIEVAFPGTPMAAE